MTHSKIKIITGFRRDQEHSIDGEEAHKAYYLFLHPEERGIFKNGLAICGKEIQEIVPDWQATMGWNPTYNVAPEDWNEIRASGADRRMNAMLTAAREVATMALPEEMGTPLTELVAKKYPALMPAPIERREGTVKSASEIVGKLGKRAPKKKRG